MTAAPTTRPASDLTVRQMLLLASRDLGSPFTASDLVVAAWKNFPSAFAMKEYPEYPDSSRVVPELSHERGLVRTGLLRRVAPKTYELTTRGAQESEKAAVYGRLPIRTAVLAETVVELARMLDATAYQRTASGVAQYITWPEALAFYGLEPSDRGRQVVTAAFDRVQVAIEDARCCLGSDGHVAVGVRQVRADELDMLDATGNRLASAFRRKFEWMRDE